MKLLIANISRSLQGGVENIVNDLCLNLPRHDIHPVVGLGEGAKYNLVDPYRNIFPEQKLVVFDGTSGRRRERQQSVYEKIKEHKPDIVLIARLYDAYEPVIRLKQEGMPIRLAVTIQAFEESYFYDLKMFNQHVDLCVTSGELVRSCAIDCCGLAADRVKNIPGGVRPPLVNRANETTNKVNIGYIGRIDEKQKRIFDLPKLLVKLDMLNIKYHFVIAGTGAQEKSLLDQIHPWIDSGQVEYLGWVDVDYLYNYVYPRLDIFVHFAHTEGVTIAPREAMANGVVPVVSNFIGLKDENQFVDRSNSLVFPVGDIDRAATLIVELINNPDLHQELSDNAKLSQQGKYSYDGAIEQWAKAFWQTQNKPIKKADYIPVNYPASGRLERLTIPTSITDFIRSRFVKNFMHQDGSGEWPTNSGLLDSKSMAELKKFIPQ